MRPSSRRWSMLEQLYGTIAMRAAAPGVVRDGVGVEKAGGCKGGGGETRWGDEGTDLQDGNRKEYPPHPHPPILWVVGQRGQGGLTRRPHSNEYATRPRCGHFRNHVH